MKVIPKDQLCAVEIKRLITTHEKFSIGRMPGIEAQALLEWFRAGFNVKSITPASRSNLETNTGFYCKEGNYDDVLQYWCEQTLEGLRECGLLYRLETQAPYDCLVEDSHDAIYVWSSGRMHQWMPYLDQRTQISYTDKGEGDWMASAAGSVMPPDKKVLIVSAFQDSINIQWPNRKKLFTTGSIIPNFEFPDFELRTIQAHNTIRGNEPFPCDNWKESFESMCREIDDIDFDIAVIGCGGYGMPLVNYIRKLGKSSIYVGSYVQVMFGIMGRRWNNVGNLIHSYYNEFWKIPEQHEVPISGGQVEGGCYWLTDEEVKK